MTICYKFSRIFGVLEMLFGDDRSGIDANAVKNFEAISRGSLTEVSFDIWSPPRFESLPFLARNPKFIKIKPHRDMIMRHACSSIGVTEATSVDEIDWEKFDDAAPLYKDLKLSETMTCIKLSYDEAYGVGAFIFQGF